MRRFIACLSVLLCTIFATAQERAPVDASPGKPHAALARFAGDWEARATFWAWKDPSAPSMECTATVRAKMIMGGRFLLQNIDGRCTDQPVEAIGVIGYDGATRRYQAASFDNMGTSIARHVGEMNDAGDIVLHSAYRDQATGETVDRRTVRTMVSEREWLETAHETRSGHERKVMEIRAQRIDGKVAPTP
jgi:Protein of unknown function (DUF1579)